MSGLTYRPLYAGLGEEIADVFTPQPWPDWVRELKGKSGVYVIRDFAGRVLYVGESHTGRLYQTLTRHFQAWTGKTAGPTYKRGGVMLAARVTPSSRAVSVQNGLICRLQPRDNTVSPACELKEPDPF